MKWFSAVLLLTMLAVWVTATLLDPILAAIVSAMGVTFGGQAVLFWARNER